MTRTTRRALLQGTAAAAATGLLSPRPARASVSAGQRRFVFLFVDGGWDITRFFLDAGSSASIEGEAEATLATAGPHSFVDHPDRPGVRVFMEAWADRVAILDGMLVRSISHEGCRPLLLTGDLSDDRADWATRLAVGGSSSHALPHLVLGSLAYPGAHPDQVVRVGQGNRLDSLLDGSFLDGVDQPVERPSTRAQAAVDAWLGRAARVSQAAAGPGARGERLQHWSSSLARARELRDLDGSISFSCGDALSSRLDLALTVLSAGLSRSVTLSHPVLPSQQAWDTHSLNDDNQALLFEELFLALDELVTGLATTPGPAGGNLLDETVVVVYSEMARTPWLTPSLGKDHWPYTSALLLGSGVAAGARVGGYDALQYGQRVDLDSGEPHDGGVLPTVEHLGATLLALGDQEAEDLPNGEPIGALLG